MEEIYLKKILPKIITRGAFIIFFVFCHNTSAAANTITKILDANTYITPPGVIASQWGNNMPEFKKGTSVIFNDYGEVIEGTLASDFYLPCVAGGPFYYREYFGGSDAHMLPNRLLNFKQNTKVTFNDKGEVTKGTVGGSFIRIPVSQTNYIEPPDGSEVSFHENGMIASCITSNELYLRPVGWRKIINENNINQKIAPGFVVFKKGTLIQLNDKGELIKGTLNKDTKLLSSNDSVKIYEAGTTVEFDDKGIVVKVSKTTNED